MKTSKKLTVTEGRTREAVFNAVSQSIAPKLKNAVENAVEDERIRTGIITKFYPYLDKAEVKLDETKKTVLCKILHRFGGDMIDFYTPLDADEEYDENLKEPYLIPRAQHNVCVLQIHDNDSDENLILGYYQNNDVVGFKPANPGNIKLMSITEPNLYWVEFGPDGLNLRLPKNPSIETGTLPAEMENGDVYTKTEVDEKIKNIDDLGLSPSELLTIAEDYNTVQRDERYTLFRGDLWTINNNYESSAAITSTSENNFTVKGTFRTNQDMVGIYWNSKDMITHPYISYGSRVDYRNVVLECDVEFENCLFDSNASTFTIQKNDGSIYYCKTRDYITYPENKPPHLKIDFNNIIIPEGSEYVDKRGNTVTVSKAFLLDVTNIKFIMFVLIPTTYSIPAPYDEHGITYYTVRSNVDFYCKFTNIMVTNGEICKERLKLPPHQYRLCEGYDDFYNLNPFRVCREMRKLGYVEWCDLYIGASHYYEKSGTVGDLIPVGLNPDEFGHSRTEKMVLDTTVPLNKAFRAWLDCYSRELKANDCPNLVVSVSMENLQCPQDWRQRDSRGNFAMTGWVPSTFFYSPCHPDILPYMQSVSEACLDIVVANDMQPILQLGEAWWWWNEYTDPTYKSPCFYDAYTKAKYKAEFGVDMEEYISPFVNYNQDMIDWLNQQIVNYSWGIRDVVKQDKYTDGLYMALFFPPSVLDTDRVPAMMQRVNFLTGIYSPEQLDVLQVEDYDWVTGNPTQPETKERDRSHHHEAYEIGEKLRFPVSKQHYFGGFVQYPEDATEFWRLIQKAMDDAIELGFAEVFVWAGSQVRRDNKILGYEDYEMVQYLLYSNEKDAIISGGENEEIPDSGNVPTGWQVFQKTEQFWNVTDDSALKYRRDNNVVKLNGVIYLHQNSGNKTVLLVGKLPAGFRPPTDQYYEANGVQSNDDAITWVCCIRTTGEVYVMNVLKENSAVTPGVGDKYTFDGNTVFMV